jgi:hypothetical protein
MFAKAKDRQVPYLFRKDSIPLLGGQVRPRTAGKAFRKDSVKEGGAEADLATEGERRPAGDRPFGLCVPVLGRE